MSYHFPDRHWVIRPYPQPPEVWAAQIEDEATCRRSLDGTLVMLKWDGATPALLQLDPQYDYAGILAVMATPAWTDPDPPEDP